MDAPVQKECEACRARGARTDLREPHHDLSFDPTMGLVLLPDGLFACGTCTMRYSRTCEEASMFHDYDEYYFEKRGFAQQE